MKLKKICKEQYEKDFKEMFKLDKNGLMTDIDCYVSNLENKINNLQSKIDKINQYLEERFIFDDENGEYYQTHTFDRDNAKELHDILKENK